MSAPTPPKALYHSHNAVTAICSFYGELVTALVEENEGLRKQVQALEDALRLATKHTAHGL